MAYNGHPVIRAPNFDEAAATGLQFVAFMQPLGLFADSSRRDDGQSIPTAWESSSGATRCDLGR